MDQQGEDLRIQLADLILVGDRQDQAPDGGGQSGAATGTQAARLRQRPDVSLIVMAVGGENVLRQTAQQELGVIGDEVQLSGAQQMATFLKQKQSLEVLIPAINIGIMPFLMS